MIGSKHAGHPHPSLIPQSQHSLYSGLHEEGPSESVKVSRNYQLVGSFVARIDAELRYVLNMQGNKGGWLEP